MNLPYRIDLAARLGEYLLSDAPGWQETKENAWRENSWFDARFTALAIKNISRSFLDKKILADWTNRYALQDPEVPKTIGIVMAGNIPLAGFHDWLAVFISGHHSLVKASSKDQVLIKHISEKIIEWEPAAAEAIQFSEMLKKCDAYIATGSNNSSRYFDYYFGKYPHIIRRNRTSAAILSGDETPGELEGLADDTHLYFGLGCRNVTKIFVPEGYDFIPLLDACKKYHWFSDHHKYMNNYDYNLALHLLNKKFYMTNGSILLSENISFFSPISQLNYEFYTNENTVQESIAGFGDLQCLVGKNQTPFGQSQSPSITDYADGVDTMAFLTSI
jgi:hypothetical protein